MKKSALAIGLAAALSAGSLAYADDVTIVSPEPDVDTTGSIVIRKPAPRVVVQEREPDVVIRQRSNVVVHESEPDVVIKERSNPKLIIQDDDSFE